MNDAMSSGWISGAGAYLERFEREVGNFLGVDPGVAVVNGTAALHLALLACGLTSGMQVVVPALTFVACPNAVAYCGGKPVFADCDPGSWNVTRASVEAVLTPRTAGVMVVHLFGLPAPVADIAALCRERGLWLVEDCAQSLGAKIGNRRVGQFGDAASFSFYGNKVISTGEGGMVFARDSSKRPLLKQLREQGMDPKHHHWHPMLGFNYRMPNTAAAIGCGQLEMIDYHLAERRRIAMRYRRNFADLERQELIRQPIEPEGYCNIYWLSTIVLERGSVENRERIRTAALEQHGIQTRPFFVPMHRLPLYQRRVTLPNAEFLGDHGLVLPTYSGLRDEDIDEISGVLSEDIVKESSS